ncbi:MAG: LacI family DNA-binding transcriptional regulator [Clostridia bacterium]|nr:LacI family DNA-binding transcriptional regulator [Clostridia bacterium]
MNIYDIAREAGVSIATVSRVINGSNKVSETTKKKVLDLVEKYQYSPNAFARGLGLGTMKTIGVLCADISNLYISEAMAHIEHGLHDYGFNSLLCCTGYDHQDKENGVKLLLSRNVDALILLGSHYTEQDDSANEYIYQAAKTVPIFMVDSVLHGENIYSIACDDYDITKLLAQKLLDSGTKSPIFLYRHDSYTCRQKIKAITDACREKGIAFGDDRVFLCPVGISGCVKTLKKAEGLLSFDTVMCDNDLLAASTLQYAQEKGFSVPEDLRVTGYDFTILSLTTTPLLTTIDNKVEHVARAVVDTLVLRLNNEIISQKTIFSADIISGRSI